MDSQVQKTIFEALKKFGAEAVDPLVFTLKDSKSSVRKEVVEILREIGDARAVEHLIAALKNADPNTRNEAINTLAVGTAITSLTDSSGGTASDTIADITEAGNAGLGLPASIQGRLLRSA